MIDVVFKMMCKLFIVLQAVKLESVHPGRTRYLVVVSCNGRQDAEESCLLGIDCHARATVGLVLRVLADTAITLDGDGFVFYYFNLILDTYYILQFHYITQRHILLSLSHKITINKQFIN